MFKPFDEHDELVGVSIVKGWQEAIGVHAYLGLNPH